MEKFVSSQVRIDWHHFGSGAAMHRNNQERIASFLHNFFFLVENQEIFEEIFGCGIHYRLNREHARFRFIIYR